MGNSKPPSRERYEQQNPVVSFRISRDVKSEFDGLVDDLDTTKKEWFESIISDERERLDTAFKRGKAEGENQGYDRGYEDGYQEGREDVYEEFVAVVPCSKCGEAVGVTTDTQRRELWDWVENLNGEWTARPPSGVLQCPIQHESCPDQE